MRKLLTLFFLLLFSVFAYAQEQSVFDGVVSEILPKLKTVKGKVVEVKGKTLVLDKGADDGLFKNYFVFVYRNMGSFVPLNSNQPVELKKGIAFATVKKLYPHKAIAVITQGMEAEKKYLLGLGIIPAGEKEIYGNPRQGDSWIAGKQSYRIAIVTRNPFIFSQLKDKLEKTGRFFVISPDTLQIALVKKRINTLYEKKAIKELARAVNADFVMLVTTIKRKELRFKLYNGYAGNVALKDTLPIDKKTQVVLNQQNPENIPPTNLVASKLRLSPKLTFWESLLGKFGLYSPYSNLQMSSNTYRVTLYKDIGYGTTAFYLGQIDNKNGNVILVAQGSKVTVYRFDIDSFDKLFTFHYGYNIINIDTAKVGGKYLVAISNFDRFGRLSSAIGYIDNKAFHAIKSDIPYHIRFYDKFSDNPKIIAQKASVAKPFYGDIYELDINSMETKKLNLPVKPNSFYNFFKIGNDIIYINQSRELSVYNTVEGKITSTVAYMFGGGERAIQRYPEPVIGNPNKAEVEKESGLPREVYIPKCLQIIKDKDGFKVLASRNYLSHNITINKQHYNGYNIKMFDLIGDKLRLEWNSGDVKGRLVGFGKDGDYIVSVIGLPASFFYRFIRGILEVDRLTAAQIEH